MTTIYGGGKNKMAKFIKKTASLFDRFEDAIEKLAYKMF